jgi:hypothetical protein
MAADHYLQCENFSPDLILEHRLAEMIPYSIDDFLDQLSDPEQLGGESAAALAGAMGAALGVLTSRLMKIDPAKFVRHRVFFRAARNCNAPEAVLVAARAQTLQADLQALSVDCPARYMPDLATAIGLALSAISGATGLEKLK